MKILNGLGPFCLLFCLTSVDAAFAIPVAPLGNLRGANDQLITSPIVPPSPVTCDGRRRVCVR